MGNKKHINIAIIVWVLIFSSMIILTACNNDTTMDPNLVVGDEGLHFAVKLSQTIPFRKAYFQYENDAAELIVDELKSFGYQPVVTDFGETNLSHNIIVRIPGIGFTVPVSDVSDDVITIKRQIIIGAHYDTFVGIDDASKYPNFNGIQDNSSGVGALLSVAREIKSNDHGYDIVIIFFGAAYDNYAGANNYAVSMTQEEIDNTDAMYCIESIYAGDKLYAHAGINSIEEGMKYLRRRKLYEISDVAITNYIDLRFNESDLDVDVDADSTLDVYREITLTKSDYTVFDQLNIPCVFLESYDYSASDIEDHIESKNPVFASTDGRIRGTNFDSYEQLGTVFEENRLENRIKNTVFLIINAIDKGIYR